MMAERTEKQKAQLAAAQAARWAKPGARERFSEALKLRHASDPASMRRGLAAMHTPEARAKRAEAQRRPLEQRFMAKYEVMPSGCWEWRGACDTKGYGQIRVDHKARLATHIALELDGRPRPGRLTACHTCDNPPCVNPAHLWWGTQRENCHDSIAKGRANQSGLAIGHALSQAKKQPLPVVTCEACGTRFTTSKYRFQVNRRHFCSRPCSHSWQSANFTGKPRGS